jgi:hypothetical protein
VLSVPLRYTDSDYPFGIFKLFLKKLKEQNALKDSLFFVKFKRAYRH